MSPMAVLSPPGSIIPSRVARVSGVAVRMGTVRQLRASMIWMCSETAPWRASTPINGEEDDMVVDIG